jgi:ribokinase
MVGRVLVAGSINMDIVAKAPRFPRIGETVAGFDLHFFPGGKGANQAVAAAKSGAPTELIGKVGQDVFGGELRAFLAKQGVGVTRVTEIKETPTGTAIITVSDAHNTIVVVAGANGLVDPSDIEAVNVEPGDILVSQFEIPIETIKALFSRGRRIGARTILNPAPVVMFERGLLDLVDILVLNETELGALTGADVGDDDEPSTLIKLARSLRRTERQVICVTLGQRGVVTLADSDVIQIAGHAVVAIDTTGAGDCFVGAMAARLAAGASIQDALKYANRAASICVQRQGAGPSMPTRAEVIEHLD